MCRSCCRTGSPSSAVPCRPTARPDQQGRFEVKGLPPGNYLALAVDYLEEGQERDPEFLQDMRPSGTSFALGEGERKTLALRIVRRD